MSLKRMSGAEIVIQSLIDQGVEVVFGYPGGAVLPIYDAIFQQSSVRHVLVRHEQGAVHMAEGYARSTGKVGVVLVTSGPGATNAVTGLTDALMDSIPIVCLTGQVPTHLIGNDAFQECDTTGITRPCTKHNYLVKEPKDLARTIHEAFFVARKGRPGPVVVDLPKDIQFADCPYVMPESVKPATYRPATRGKTKAIEKAVDVLSNAKKPIFYGGGGIINAGPAACKKFTDFVRATGYPCTLTLMGLGAFPASDKHFLGMLGMHGTYEANMAMHDCDVMIAVGSRFDDRITGRLDAFAPDAKIIHIDIDPSSINKNVAVDIPIIGNVSHVLGQLAVTWDKKKNRKGNRKALNAWWKQIEDWRSRDCLSYKKNDEIIKPQYALERLQALTEKRDTFITTEVGQHQMWAAQFLKFDKPNHWMTSGGLGTMGYGFPAALGVQTGHPGKLVIDIAGEASFMMNMQEISTAVQHHLPVKVFILNNEYLGMVRQWQELLHGGRYSESYAAALPDFVKLAESFGAVGLRANKPSEIDDVITEMVKVDNVVIADIVVDPTENVYPMIPSGSPHNEMLLGPAAKGEGSGKVTEKGKVLV
ncbi:MAG: acetolactate synthase 3 large subunit [Rhodospirillaceae bacterium]|nr:acetolactate synthase 3 large subunit [Rhodospirillaceae bacterium]